MTVFRLKYFPHVCRLCLHYEESLVPVNKDMHSYDGKLGDLIDELTLIQLPEEITHLTPTGVCQKRFEAFECFLAYRKHLWYVMQFTYSLAQLRRGDPSVLHELFVDHREPMLMMLQKLQLLSVEKNELNVQELLDEFEEYGISSILDEGKNEYTEMELQEKCGTNSTQDKEKHKHMAAADESDEDIALVNYVRRHIKTERALLNDQQIYELPRKKHSPQEPIDGEIPPEDAEEDVELGKELEPATERVKVLDFETDAELNDAVVRKRGNPDAQKRHHTRTSARRCIKNRDEGSSQLQCRKCKFVAACSESFQLHMENHQKMPKPVVCKRCNLTFDSQKELKSHRHSEHRDYICDSCGMSFAVKFSLDEHRKRHEPVRPYKCEYCPLEYYTKAEKRFHVRQVHLKTYEVKCKECGLRFKHNAELKQHSKSHTNQRWYECAQCGFSFKSHTHLNRHIKGVHELQRHQCEHCSMSYCRRDKLRMHIEKKHNIQMYFVCDICLQSYNTAKKLDEHKNHHQNPKDQQCGMCLGAFLTTKEFSDHLCITYRENYICCNRDFKYHYFYNKHMLLVHGKHTNVRVKPAEGILTGQFRALRSQEKWCPICEQLIPAWCTKKQHMAKCGTTVHKTEYIENTSLETTTNDNTLEISIIGPRANNN